MPRVRTWLLPSAEIVTVGLPFCVFKLLTGVLALQSVALAPVGQVIGWLLVALGVVDTIVNVVNLGALLVVQRRVVGVCVTEIVLRRSSSAARSDLGLALDVFVSFLLVAIVIGVGALRLLPPSQLAAWNVAVVLNVLGAGVGRLFAALRSERSAT